MERLECVPRLKNIFTFNVDAKPYTMARKTLAFHGKMPAIIARDKGGKRKALTAVIRFSAMVAKSDEKDERMWVNKMNPATPLFRAIVVRIARFKKSLDPAREYIPIGDDDRYTVLVNDAIKGVLCADDSQFTTSLFRKRYVASFEQCGYTITVAELDE